MESIKGESRSADNGVHKRLELLYYRIKIYIYIYTENIMVWEILSRRSVNVPNIMV
jgi:hypothetical protein